MLVCMASVAFGVWLWWRFPIFYDLGGEAGYWGGMVIFGICWPLILPLLALGFLVAYIIRGILWICSPTFREEERVLKRHIRGDK
jgi:hypothetical protein